MEKEDSESNDHAAPPCKHPHNIKDKAVTKTKDTQKPHKTGKETEMVQGLKGNVQSPKEKRGEDDDHPKDDATKYVNITE